MADTDDRERELLEANIRTLAKDPVGREFIWTVLSMCGIYHNQFSGNSTTFFLEGKRAVGLELIELLGDADETIYPSLLLEKAKEAKDE